MLKKQGDIITIANITRRLRNLLLPRS